jgi:hypothetical protein
MPPLPHWFWFAALPGALLFVLTLVWYLKVGRRRPSLERDWAEDCARIPSATIEGRQVTLHGVRHFVWRTSRDFDACYADETYDVGDLVGVWYVVEHFHWIRGVAHVMLSFEFSGQRFVTCSFETRRTKGQRYSPWKGIWRGFELLLLWGGEEDLIRLRTNGRKSRVHLFPCSVPEGKGEALFLDLCQRANQLAQRPEWYHTLRTTCTTSLTQAINRVTPGRVPFMWRLLLPGHSPRAAYRLGLLRDEENVGYDAILEKSLITPRAQAHEGLEGWSQAVR